MIRRNTPAKEAVLNILTLAGKAMSQDAIEQEIDLEINRATIYRILNSFCDDGILHRIVADDGKQYFAISDKSDQNKKFKSHYHFKCLQCERIECLPVEVTFSISDDYLVQNVNCILTGVCKSCRTL